MRHTDMHCIAVIEARIFICFGDIVTVPEYIFLGTIYFSNWFQGVLKRLRRLSAALAQQQRRFRKKNNSATRTRTDPKWCTCSWGFVAQSPVFWLMRRSESQRAKTNRRNGISYSFRGGQWDYPAVENDRPIRIVRRSVDFLKQFVFNQ